MWAVILVLPDMPNPGGRRAKLNPHSRGQFILVMSNLQVTNGADRIDPISEAAISHSEKM